MKRNSSKKQGLHLKKNLKALPLTQSSQRGLASPRLSGIFLRKFIFAKASIAIFFAADSP